MKKIKQFFADFKKFITRGNVIDMAVAVIIGAAFNAIVTTLTNNKITPLVDFIVIKATGGNAMGLFTMLDPVYTEDAEGKLILDMAKSTYIDWSAFIMAIIDFLLIAIVLFVIIKVFMGLQNMRNEIASADKRALRKEAKARAAQKGISKSEAMAEIVAEKKAEEEAAAAAKAAEEAAKPTPEKLLIEIRDLLAKQFKPEEAEAVAAVVEEAAEEPAEEKAEEVKVEKPEKKAKK